MLTIQKINELRKLTYKAYEEDLAAINRVLRLAGQAGLVVPPFVTMQERAPQERKAKKTPRRPPGRPALFIEPNDWVVETKADLGLETLREAVQDAEALLKEDQ